MSSRFHLAIPVRSIEESKEFYCDFLGCEEGNCEEGKWQDINFWGNELTLHEADHALPNERHHVDMGQVCVPHFGIHLTRDVFDSIKEKIETHDEFKYLDEPYLRFKDDEQEHHDIGLEHDAENAPAYKIMSKFIEFGCKTAIAISKKI